MPEFLLIVEEWYRKDNSLLGKGNVHTDCEIVFDSVLLQEKKIEKQR